MNPTFYILQNFLFGPSLLSYLLKTVTGFLFLSLMAIFSKQLAPLKTGGSDFFGSFSVFPTSTHPQYNSFSFFRAGNMLVFNSLTTD